MVRGGRAGSGATLRGSPRGPGPSSARAFAARDMAASGAGPREGAVLANVLEVGARRGRPGGAMRCPWRPWTPLVEAWARLGRIAVARSPRAGAESASHLGPSHLIPGVGGGVPASSAGPMSDRVCSFLLLLWCEGRVGRRSLELPEGPQWVAGRESHFLR